MHLSEGYTYISIYSGCIMQNKKKRDKTEIKRQQCKRNK